MLTRRRSCRTNAKYYISSIALIGHRSKSCAYLIYGISKRTALLASQYVMHSSGNLVTYGKHFALLGSQNDSKGRHETGI
jgi:hypothetical protein